jgi:hypothetical protein
MSIPNTPEKHGARAVIEPLRVVQQRAKHGLGHSGPNPAGVIICSDMPL